MGNFEKCYLGSHFLPSFLCWLGCGVRLCWVLFSLPFTIAVGLGVMTAFCHRDSCIPGLVEWQLIHKSTQSSFMVLGVWVLGPRSQSGSGNRPESSFVEAGSL